jgi:hypothetical protein
MKQNQNIKTLLLAIAVIFASTVTNAQANVGIGTPTPDASAKLDVTSINQGILVPRMTTAARTGIASPAKGLMLYDSTIKAFYYHNGTAWGQVGGAAPGTTALPNCFLGHTTTSGQAFNFSNPFSIASSTTNPNIVSVFLIPATTTFTIGFYSYENEGLTYELFAATPLATANTFTTPGSALATCATAAWSSGSPIFNSFTYTAAVGQIYTLKVSKTGGGSITDAGSYFTAFSAN